MATKPARQAFDDAHYVDYKDLRLLRFVTSYYGKIKPRRYTGLTARQQRQAATAIKKARIMGLLFFVKD
jgi:small subunit ribosomal protein S18